MPPSPLESDSISVRKCFADKTVKTTCLAYEIATPHPRNTSGSWWELCFLSRVQAACVSDASELLYGLDLGDEGAGVTQSRHPPHLIRVGLAQAGHTERRSDGNANAKTQGSQCKGPGAWGGVDEGHTESWPAEAKGEGQGCGVR